MIEHRCKTRLVLAVGLAALLQSRLMTAVLAAVALAAIKAATDIKDDAAFWTSTHPLAYLDVWQGGRVFPRAGLDNRRQSWPAMDDSYGGALIGAVRLRPQPRLRLGPFLLCASDVNKPLETKRLQGGGRKISHSFLLE
jgi:hypothetical protein